MLDAAPRSFVSEVRKALSSDPTRVKAFLGGLKDLEFGGREGDPGYEQLQSWRELQTAGELPAGFALPMWARPGTTWCTMSIRASGSMRSPHAP